jgi:hypothetical protein
VAGSRKVFSTIASLLIKYVIEIEWQEATRKGKGETIQEHGIMKL